MHLSKSLTFVVFLTSFADSHPQTDMSKRDLINPDDPYLSKDQQCTYKAEFSAIYKFNVVINDAKAFTKYYCGHGFLDNMHGEACTVTNWGCNYDGDSMNANFQTDLGCDPGDIESAISKAFGGKFVHCNEYFHF
ncbi:hypothetical protein N7532_002360 [Penicillium argentinense]|uniref:Uncharacterized protein n=1 Tax=Penicillium argentinense TaxID=1131581 RepID=A0A9W9G152_9EURO|nr:uncharacterized protein N7532_002360 [Penicillium argentinense]KAJ5109715.1 hypothetical protein N7532_002360 [Penicillium argentinense]